MADESLRGRDVVGLGGLLVAGVVLGTLLGLLLDHLAGTDPLFTVLGVLLGMVLGGGAAVLRVRSALRR